MARSANIAAAGLVAIAAIAPARALEVGQLVDQWSSPDVDECVNSDDGEAVPLRIAVDSQGTHIASSGGLCTVKSWTEDGAFLLGKAEACGMEGGDDPFEQTFELGPNGRDELLMSRNENSGLRRCPESR